MAFRTNKSIFYHIPRTGGMWAKGVARRSGVMYDRAEKNSIRHRLSLMREHGTPEGVKESAKEGLFSFAFVRMPFEWYKSFWAHRKIHEDSFVAAFPLDFAWDSNFEKFIINNLRMFPHGFLTDVYQCFVGKDGKDLDFVGKQENLTEDLIKALTLAGEEFNERTIRRTKRFNVATGRKEVEGLFNISNELKQELMEKEKWVTDTFYK